MPAPLNVPHHSYDDLRILAKRFLDKYHPESTLPVPIEEIIEFTLGLNIIPVPGLQSAFEVDGFISSDLSSITVDQFILQHRINRYRFTLAHEVAHWFLHRDLFEQHRFTSVEEWKEFQQNIDEQAYG